MRRAFRAGPGEPAPRKASGLAFALGAVAVAVFLPGNLGPVADQEAGVAGEFILSLGDDLDYELLSDEFAARDPGAVQPVSLVQLLHNTAGVGSIR
ncbi:hypothetical protein ARTHRO8AJ_240034 [Arthrobacter sp. 8AJ]|nr:hypothetical protein ARTHRO8AJ_240034 [Arthrobacter sp. 8AJ]